MPILTCYITDDDEKRLKQISSETYRKVEELAEAAISEAIIGYFKTRKEQSHE